MLMATILRQTGITMVLGCKIMKRTILILILALLSTVAFAGCGNSCGNTEKESTKDTTEIVQPTDDETDDKTDDETDDKTDEKDELKPVTPVSNGGNFKAN